MPAPLVRRRTDASAGMPGEPVQEWGAALAEPCGHGAVTLSLGRSTWVATPLEVSMKHQLLSSPILSSRAFLQLFGLPEWLLVFWPEPA